jgi:CBS domain-containing protein
MTVGEVMIAKPKTLPGNALVADVRRAFENPSVRTVLLADDGIFRGAIERDLLPSEAAVDEPASRYVERDPMTTTPTVPIVEAIELLDARPEPRLIVLDDDGATLRGLLCFNRSSSGFCVK